MYENYIMSTETEVLSEEIYRLKTQLKESYADQSWANEMVETLKGDCRRYTLLIERLCDFYDGEPDGRIRQVSDDIDMLDVEPLAGNGRTNIGFVLVIG